MAGKSTLDIIIRTKSKGRGAKQASVDLRKIGVAFGVAAAAAVAAKQAFDFAEEGARLSRLSDASGMMADQFGQDMNAIVNAMEDASNRTVSRMDLMAAASKALQLGVAKTPEEFAKLAKASIALGRAMGRGPVDAINDITTGIGRMSPLILDNLGILTKGMPQGLADVEKKQWLFNKALEASIPLLDENGNLMDDAASGFDRLAVSTENASNRLKEAAGNALAPYADRLAETIELDTLHAEQVKRATALGWKWHEVYFLQAQDLERLSATLEMTMTPSEQAAAGFQEAADAAGSLRENVKGARMQVKSYADWLTDNWRTLALAGAITGGGIGTRLGRGRGDIEGGQHGGTFNPFQSFIAGERGPEVVTAGAAGATVTPNNITNNITATINNRTEGAAFEAFLRSLQ